MGNLFGLEKQENRVVTRRPSGGGEQSTFVATRQPAGSTSRHFGHCVKRAKHAGVTVLCTDLDGSDGQNRG